MASPPVLVTWAAPGTVGPGQAGVRTRAGVPRWANVPGRPELSLGAGVRDQADVLGRAGVRGRGDVLRWTSVPGWISAPGGAAAHTRHRCGRRHAHGCQITGRPARTRDRSRASMRTRGRATAGRYSGTCAIARWPTGTCAIARCPTAACAIARKPVGARAIGSWPAGARALAGA